MTPRFRQLVPSILILAGLFATTAQAASTGDPAKGKDYFTQNCAICHADVSGPGGAAITRQGPTMVGVFGRSAGAGEQYSYTNALRHSGLTWDAGSLDRFLTNPSAAVPGTNMPVAVEKAEDRANVIAYLQTLKAAPANLPAPTPAPVAGDANDWHHNAPGARHHLMAADLPRPFSTTSAGNGPRMVKMPPDAAVACPPGFTVRLFASGLHGPRILRTAPNGDIFVAETSANRIRVLRAADGEEEPSDNETFAEGLDRPFGIAFYPAGDDPRWVYVANNNSVVRFAYRNGDLKEAGEPEIVVPQLAQSSRGGHSTRDVAFSRDGKRMFISVGSGSNVADGMSKKSVEDAQKWEAEHGRGATWDSETNRADILVTDPEGHAPLHAFATGIRNGVGIAVDPLTGELWTSTNERDGLGDDLVPDYITHVKEGGYYGWPWYYLGNHEDPRKAGERPDLAGQAIIPDVWVQAHSASLEMTFYNAKPGAPAAFPAEYQGDIFAALHGSWNRNSRTGYKIVRVRVKDGVATGEYEDFVTGFVVNEQNVWGRPVGVTVAHDGALLIAEDGNNTIWRVAPGAVKP